MVKSILVALSGFALPLIANACLTISGDGHAGSPISNSIKLTAHDNGIKVCDGDGGDGETGDIPCKDGYSLSFDWFAIGDGPEVHYCNIAGDW